MTLVCIVKMTPVQTDRGTGIDWSVQVGDRSVEGFTAGDRREAWHDVREVSEALWEEGKRR